MSFPFLDLSCDGFLDGRLQVLQPQHGYRAATDPVFLAAAIKAKPGQSVLELGCGVGVASLCLGARVSGLQLFGLELQPEYAELAQKNAEANKIPLTVTQGDLAHPPQQIALLSFDHVMFNPPYFSSGTTPRDSGKQIAHMEQTPLDAWIRTGFRRLKPRGVINIIHLAERLPDLLTCLPKDAGDICIRPLTARVGRDAKRVIVTARKGSAGPARLLSAFHIHQDAEHQKDGDDYTKAAKNILRNGLGFEG